VFSGEPVLDPLLDASAPVRERNGIAVTADKRVDVRLRRGDATVFGDKDRQR
jgi:hypothetical protein